MIKKTRFLIVYALIIIAGLYINLHSDIKVPLNKPFKEFPVQNKGWQMVSESQFDEDILRVLKPTDYLLRTYVGPDGVPVSLYIGYHGGGKDSGPIHSPKNCLPGGGWFKLTEDKVTFYGSQKGINAVKAVYQKSADKTLFLYWYNMRGKSITNEFALKFAEITNSIFYRRRESAFIRVSVTFESDEDKAFSVGKKFINDFYPVIENFLPE